MLQLNNVSRSFEHAQEIIPVLCGLNLVSSKGESVAIVGPSGSGKTTLLSLIAGLDRPDSGQVILDSQDLSLLSETELAGFRSRRIGIVFQQFHLMPHLTALENVALPLWLQQNPDADQLAKDALHKVNLSARCNHFPWQMSGGECQRVAIARALVIDPALILADEPTGNLDPEHAKTVAELLFGLCQKQEVNLILVTHSPSLASQCDRKLQLLQGRLEHNIDASLL